MFSDIEAKLKKKNKILFSRDSQCLQELKKSESGKVYRRDNTFRSAKNKGADSKGFNLKGSPFHFLQKDGDYPCGIVAICIYQNLSHHLRVEA